MLNKSVKVISYTALSLTLLMGKITIPTGYFEDEGSFASVPSKLNQGWGFSFNKAFACGEDTGEDTIECIGVYGTPPPDPWGGVDDSYDSEDTYEQDEDQEGDGGDDGDSATTTPDPNAVEQCKMTALLNKQAAYRNIDALMQATLVLCTTINKIPYALATCQGAAIWAANDAKADVDITYTTAVNACN